MVHDLEIALDQQVLHPVLTDLARFAVGDQLVGVEGDVEIQIVVDHHLHRPRLGDAADVGVDRFAREPARRTVAVTVDPAPGSQLVEELRRHDLVVLLGHVAQSVFERDDRVVSVEVEAARRCAPDSGLERLRFGKLGQLDGENWIGHRILRVVIVTPCRRGAGGAGEQGEKGAGETGEPSQISDFPPTQPVCPQTWQPGRLPHKRSGIGCFVAHASRVPGGWEQSEMCACISS